MPIDHRNDFDPVAARDALKRARDAVEAGEDPSAHFDACDEALSAGAYEGEDGDDEEYEIARGRDSEDDEREGEDDDPEEEQGTDEEIGETPEESPITLKKGAQDSKLAMDAARLARAGSRRTARLAMDAHTRAARTLMGGTSPEAERSQRILNKLFNLKDGR